MAPGLQRCLFASCLSLLGLAACRHTVLESTAVLPGVASYVVVPHPGTVATEAAEARRSGDDSGEETAPSLESEYFVAAEPRGLLEAPIYPAGFIAPGGRAVILTVRVRLDAQGAVREVFASPGGLSTAGQARELFLQAVREAAQRWSFVPARVFQTQPPATPGGIAGLRRETVESFLDLQFTFLPPGQ